MVNNFLFAGDKFMPEMPLKQPEFRYNACGPFTKHKEREQNLKIYLSKYIYNIYNIFINIFITMYLSKRTRESLFST